MAMEVLKIMAPPTPWVIRRTTKGAYESAKTMVTELMPKTTSPPRKSRRLPMRSPTLAKGNWKTAEART